MKAAMALVSLMAVILASCAQGPMVDQVVGSWCGRGDSSLTLGQDGVFRLEDVQNWGTSIGTKRISADGRWSFVEGQSQKKLFFAWWGISMDLDGSPALFEIDYVRALSGGPDYLRILPFETRDEDLLRFYRCGGIN